MTVHTSPLMRLLAISTLFAVVLTSTVPHFCSTGWCCSKHQAEQKAVEEQRGCCAEETTPAVVQDAASSDCCGGGGINAAKSDAPISDNSCDSGCATGCCKIAGMSFVLMPPSAMSILAPVSTLVFATVFNTGIELADFIPKPPRVLIA